MCWCPGDDCIADLFTKSVDAPKFRKFTRFILGEATQEHSQDSARLARLLRVPRLRHHSSTARPFALGVCGRHVTTLGVVVAVSAWLSGQCTRAESRAPALSSKRLYSLLCVDAAGFAVARARPRVPPARSSSRCRSGCRAPVSCVDRREGFQLRGMP